MVLITITGVTYFTRIALPAEKGELELTGIIQGGDKSGSGRGGPSCRPKCESSVHR